MKQTLKITHFIGRSENAVRIQIAVALIAFLLLKILNKMSQDKQTLLDTTRLVRSNLMHRKDFTRLRQLHPPSQLDSQQFMLNWASTCTGQPWDKPGHDEKLFAQLLALELFI